MTNETKQIDVIMGPYRGVRLTVPVADADAAVEAHWARDPHSGEEYGTAHDPLTEEERVAALDAANAWAQAQYKAGTPPPVEGRETQPEARDMQAAPRGSYRTRDA